MSAREFLQRNYDNEVKLRQFEELIWPFLNAVFFINETVWNSLTEIIDGHIEIIKMRLIMT